MRRVLVSTTAVALLAAAGHVTALGQANDRNAREKQIVAAEYRVIEAIVKGDVGAFKSLVANDGWAVGPTGPMSNAEFEKHFKEMKIEAGWKISDTKFVWAASNTAVLFYKWTGKATYQGQPLPGVAWASTVWHESDKKWVAVFHQETAAAEK